VNIFKTVEEDTYFVIYVFLSSVEIGPGTDNYW